MDQESKYYEYLATETKTTSLASSLVRKPNSSPARKPKVGYLSIKGRRLPLWAVIDSTSPYTMVSKHVFQQPEVLQKLPEDKKEGIPTVCGKLTINGYINMTMKCLELSTEDDSNPCYELNQEIKAYIFQEPKAYQAVIGKDLCDIMGIDTSETKPVTGIFSSDQKTQPSEDDIVFVGVGVEEKESVAKKNLMQYCLLMYSIIKEMEHKNEIPKNQCTNTIAEYLAELHQEEEIDFWSCQKDKLKNILVYEKISPKDAATKITQWIGRHPDKIPKKVPHQIGPKAAFERTKQAINKMNTRSKMK
jgi:hypothetical protein